jgi:quercetin dioxygenase-like cupin family protein
MYRNGWPLPEGRELHDLFHGCTETDYHQAPERSGAFCVRSQKFKAGKEILICVSNGEMNNKPEKDIAMKFGLLALLSVAGVVLAMPVRAEGPVVVRPVASVTQTWTGQPIVLPRKDAQVLASTYEIAPGAVLPVHKHPYPRYAYVQAGLLRVTAPDRGKSQDFKAGDFIVESVGEWHYGTNIGTEPVKLLVMDFVPKGRNNTVIRK